MIIEFPKESRSEFEKILRAALAEHFINMPQELITPLSKDFEVVLNKWQAGKVSLSYTLPSNTTPEAANEIEKVIRSACQEGMGFVIRNATKERIQLWVSGRLSAS